MPVNGVLREVGFKRLMSAGAAEALRAATGIAPLLAATPWLWRGR